MKYWKGLSKPSKIILVLWPLDALYMLFSGQSETNLAQWLIVWLFGIVLFVGITELICKILKNVKRRQPIKTSSAITAENVSSTSIQNNIQSVTKPQPELSVLDTQALDTDSIIFPDWYVSISFGKSSSNNYDKAVVLAKSAPQYHEQIDNGNILHQAIYSSKPREFLAFVMLYELVGNWKSSFVIINGKLIDRKIIGKLNYCYGDKCRSGNKNFCYGASYMTENPFGCHRLQISAVNNPWWSFYRKSGLIWYLDKSAMKNRIDEYANIYQICPDFDYETILAELNKLPEKLSDRQMKQLAEKNFGLKM